MYCRMSPYAFGVLAAFHHLNDMDEHYLQANVIKEYLCFIIVFIINFRGTWPYYNSDILGPVAETI